MDEMYSRTGIIIGDDGVQKLRSSSVLLCGCGAVGGYAAESLVRMGVGRMTFADGDVFDVSNLNRQVLCTRQTVGRPKQECAVERALSINPDGDFRQFSGRIDSGSVDGLLSEGFDVVTDCIDTMACKAALIRCARQRGIKVISSMGSAMHTDPMSFRVSTLDNTSVCPVARILRKELKDIDRSQITVVYSEETPVEPTEVRDRHGKSVLGSLPTVTAVQGNLVQSEVVKYLLSRP